MINPFENPDQRNGRPNRGFSKYIRNLCKNVQVGEAVPIQNKEMSYGTVRVLLHRYFRGQFESTRSLDGVIWIKRKCMESVK